MLGEPKKDGTYAPPSLIPSLIQLESRTEVGSALHQYVRYVGVHGRRPIEIGFSSPERS